MADKPVRSTPCLIVGAGAAGYSAALWLREFKVPFEWISLDGQLGGILARVNNPIRTIPGQPLERGKDALTSWRAQLAALELAPPKADEVTSITLNAQGTIEATLKRTGQLDAKALLLATGTRYRRLDIPGEREGLGDYVSQSVSGDVGKLLPGSRAAIVGGGDAAYEGALILARAGHEVELLSRSDPPRARQEFVDEVNAHPKITVWPIPTIVTQVKPAKAGCALVLEAGDELEVAKLFVRVGVEPVIIPGIAPALEHDEEGYLYIDPRQRTSCAQIYAAGDVISDPLQAVSWAMGQGARAARAIAFDLGYFGH